MNSTTHKKIYQTAIKVLEGRSLPYKRLIEEIITELYGYSGDNSAEVGEYTEIRGYIGAVISEMKSDGVLLNNNGYLCSAASTHLALRMESCEKEIVKFLSQEPKSKEQIRNHLQKYFKTNRTPNDGDDRIIFNHMGEVLRRLISDKKISLADGRYSLRPEIKAEIHDVTAMLELKDTFLCKMHRSGGEFFEHYIVTLLQKYLTRLGNKVTEARVLGGSHDGGIDGIIRQVTPLGFRETIMLQAKNRTDAASETTLRSFYGALCASEGTHGIFATTSDIHPSAKIFLSGIDNCIFLSGDDVFNMACECLYGICKKSGKLTIDNKVF